MRRFSREVTEIVGRHLESMPTFPGVGISVHSLRGESAKTRKGTCFAAREVHDMIEILTVVSKEKDAASADGWGEGLFKELKACSEATTTSYVSVTQEGQNSLENIYGEHWTGLLKLKSKYDPHGTFSLAYPRISI